MPKKKASKQKNVRRPIQLSRVLLFVFNIALPITLYFLITWDLVEWAIALVLLSKWRTIAVQPRHWVTSIRSNAVDLTVKLSTLTFMVQVESEIARIAWTGWYIFWLIVIKPKSATFWMALQAFIGQVLGMSALLEFSETVPEPVIMLGSLAIAIVSSRHFLSNYDEPMARPISYIWGLFVLMLTWTLYRWMLVYYVVPQLVLVVALFTYMLGSLYDSFSKGTANKRMLNQHIALSSVVLLILIFFSDWSGEI